MLKTKFSAIARTESLHHVPLDVLRPTQITVGLREVKAKQKKLAHRKRHPGKLLAFLLERPIRVVLGPGGHAYVIDHHHLGVALLREGFKTAPVVIEADYSDLNTDDFWAKMEKMKYVHPYDENGKRRVYSALPLKLADMKDDPYRSLAGFARWQEAFRKAARPFAEFAWADFFRARIPAKMVKHHFNRAVRCAVDLAHTAAARKLPGFVPG